MGVGTKGTSDPSITPFKEFLSTFRLLKFTLEWSPWILLSGPIYGSWHHLCPLTYLPQFRPHRFHWGPRPHRFHWRKGQGGRMVFDGQLKNNQYFSFTNKILPRSKTPIFLLELWPPFVSTGIMSGLISRSSRMNGICKCTCWIINKRTDFLKYWSDPWSDSTILLATINLRQFSAKFMPSEDNDFQSDFIFISHLYQRIIDSRIHTIRIFKYNQLISHT